MGFSHIEITIQVTELQDKGNHTLVSGIFQQKDKQVPVLVELYGKARELATKLENALAHVSGKASIVNNVLTINSRTIFPAAVPGFSNLTIEGRIAFETELKSTSNGKVRFANRLAVQRSKNEEVSWFGFSALEKTAELLNQYTEKGNLILLNGNLSSYHSEKNGLTINLNVTDFTFLPNKNANEGSGTANFKTESSSPVTASSPETAKSWDEIPF